MLLFSLPKPAPASAPGPLQASAYLRLRREAAGLTVEGLAEMIAPRHADRSEARALIRMLETPGVRARDRVTIDLFADHFTVDREVYHQLATQPAEQHPAVCRACGCSDDDPCRGHRGVCSWASPRLCTRCADIGVAIGEAA